MGSIIHSADGMRPACKYILLFTVGRAGHCVRKKGNIIESRRVSSLAVHIHPVTEYQWIVENGQKVATS